MYTWDARNQMSQMSNASDTPFQVMNYDALGRRQTAGAPNQYFNDMVTYLHDGSTNIASSGYLTGSRMLTGLDGELLSYTDNGYFGGGATRVPLHDGQGNTIATINSSGTMDTQYTYEPFGNFQASGSGAPSGYAGDAMAGMEMDPTGLYHANARYYSPTPMRFLNEDPERGKANMYSYAGNNPVTSSDPSGMSSIWQPHQMWAQVFGFGGSGGDNNGPGLTSIGSL